MQVCGLRVDLQSKQMSKLLTDSRKVACLAIASWTCLLLDEELAAESPR